MSVRLTYRRRKSYNTRSNKIKRLKTPGRFFQAGLFFMMGFKWGQVAELWPNTSLRKPGDPRLTFLL
jgi:Ribosomal protein L34e